MFTPDYCAIDFGTSNSAIAIPAGGGMRLAALEPGFHTMPTAVFYNAEDESRSFGRAAITAYVEGCDGRLMRSIKSVLGSGLMEQTTEIGHGIAVRYLDVVTGYLRHLKSVAESQLGRRLQRAIIGRPVCFVDGDPERDAKAQAALETAALAAGFSEVAFQYEPIAAAFDYEATIADEEIVLVADIGGGTSDFSLVRVGPARRDAIERHADILASHGIHIAGTDFDLAVNLAAIMPALGFGSQGPAGRRVPGRIYFDLATWHLINTVYAHNRVIELREMITLYADAVRYRRLMTVVTKRLGHHLAAVAEQTKIEVAQHGLATVDLAAVEAGLKMVFTRAEQDGALEHNAAQIVNAALATLRLAGLDAARVGAIYFTGGSTGLGFLTGRIAALFPHARSVAGDRYSSVVSGLGIYAMRRFSG